jgi:hypothetical protein
MVQRLLALISLLVHCCGLAPPTTNIYAAADIDTAAPLPSTPDVDPITPKLTLYLVFLQQPQQLPPRLLLLLL